MGTPHDPAHLARAFDGIDAVVNLVGILHEGGRQTFRACHVELPRSIAQACRVAGVQHLVHMSALGADPNGASSGASYVVFGRDTAITSGKSDTGRR